MIEKAKTGLTETAIGFNILLALMYIATWGGAMFLTVPTGKIDSALGVLQAMQIGGGVLGVSAYLRKGGEGVAKIIKRDDL